MSVSAPMTTQRIFSVLFSQFWLMVYYHDCLKTSRPDKGALSHFLDSLWYGPRIWAVTTIKHHSGFCYSVDLGREFLSDNQGRSVLLLTEQGAALPLAHTRQIQEIVNQGRGRYAHSGRTLHFSPHDNADITTVLQRKYTVIERVFDNPEVNKALGKLNGMRDSFANPALFGLEKLKIIFDKKLSFGGLADLGPTALGVRNLTLDLSKWHLGKWTIETLNLRAVHKEASWIITCHFSNTHADFFSDSIDGNIEFQFEQNGTVKPRSLQLALAGKPWISAIFEWSGYGIQEASIHLSNLNSLRTHLIRCVGGEPEAYSRWLENFLSAWTAGKFNFTCALTPQEAERVTAALEPNSTQSALFLSLRRVDTQLSLFVEHTAKASEEATA